MNQHPGASYSLSVLIVVVVSIALYRPEPAPPKRVDVGARPGPRSGSSDEAKSVTGRTAPEAQAATPDAPPAPAPPTPVAAVEPPRVTAPRARPSDTTAAAVRQISRAVKAANPPPRGYFTDVRAGESLDDVAFRVYGTPDAADQLWRANRDRLATKDGPLRIGMPLRTP